MNGFEPIIIGFFCNWCAYEGADAAGRARLACPVNLKVVRVMCSGRTDPRFILEALTEGADGVLVLGCPAGSCHYKKGNVLTLKRYTLLKKMLVQFGIEADRVRLDWISAGEAEKYVDVVSGMVEKVKRLGPLNIN